LKAHYAPESDKFSKLNPVRLYLLILKNQIEIVTLDKIINSFEMNPNLDDSAHVQLDNIDIRQLIDLVEKTICCLGQTNVTGRLRFMVERVLSILIDIF
jgi:hypothetical protein